jgi:RNA polymerase sigma-70 factor, ECF subfamily
MIIVALEGNAGPAHGRVVEARDTTVVALVLAARGGSRSAFAGLYERFHRIVHAVALARVPARDAGDVVQDVFADAWVKLVDLREPAAFPGWLLVMARNRAADHARRRPPSGDGDAGDRVGVEPPPRAEAEAALRALRELPETYRETLIMRLIEGLSGPEIAERTGMTPDSVRVHLHRGLKLLRERLGGVEVP